MLAHISGFVSRGATALRQQDLTDL
jgi:hypothetical protein